MSTPAQNYLAKFLGAHSDGKLIYGIACPDAAPSIRVAKFLGAHSDGQEVHGINDNGIASGEISLGKFVGYHTDGKQVYAVSGCGEIPCNFCIDGIISAQMLVSFSGLTDNTCSSCSSAGGSYVCSRNDISPGGDACRFVSAWSFLSACSVYSAASVVFLATAGTVQASLEFSNNASGTPILGRITYVASPGALLDCDNLVDYNVPFNNNFSAPSCLGDSSTCLVNSL